MTAAERKRVQVVHSAPLSSDVVHIFLEVLGQSRFVFRPGQYVCLCKRSESRRLRCYYSIASAPNGTNRFELCMRRARGKHAPEATFVQGMKVGDCFDLEGPEGSFVVRDNSRESVFVAHGTGISPVRSMLQYLLGGGQDRTGGQPLTLIFGARSAEQLYFRDEFEQLQRRHANFRFWPTLSRPPKGWSGRRGYAQEHVLEALGGKTSGVNVYLCGRREMVAETRSQLLERGFDESSIIQEKY